ncbi:MAG: glycosyltransferase [Candidatus Scalindua rubra]|uniref:Glycosyltransferase n=1 Tax=Candidatus Scalindua brodae TaxID=237368 RepID=A0A0B0EL56_9BACT|nr:MAG: glycosyltransferase [Candidatus Scalindua brodae]MBZ0109944.1 glycosyltransferase [Candidatus Scalindua rubra]TWU35482.1 Chondroitin synthase [Candidatus Brocadiaceae bacterium S225]
MTELQISVVIATYNRSKILPITLQYLAEQTLSPDKFEVVIVDDGSPDNTEEVVRSLQTDLPFKILYLKHPNKGICYTQNRGIRAANAPIICLIADDIHLAPQALKEHMNDHMQCQEDNIAILGKVIQSPALNQSVFLKVWDPFRFSELENLRQLPDYLFFACNISFKRKFLIDNGMFNENLVKGGAYAHEDVELGYRLCKKGLKILYNKKALGYHYHLVTLDQAMQTAYKKGLTWVKLRKVVDDPALTIRYHVLNPRFLKDYHSVFKSHNGLLGLDSNPFLLIAGQVIRVIMFNLITVPYIWYPLMKCAEKNTFIARFMHKLFYRCAISYHFHKGVADVSKTTLHPS